MLKFEQNGQTTCLNVCSHWTLQGNVERLQAEALPKVSAHSLLASFSHSVAMAVVGAWTRVSSNPTASLWASVAGVVGTVGFHVRNAPSWRSAVHDNRQCFKVRFLACAAAITQPHSWLRKHAAYAELNTLSGTRWRRTYQAQSSKMQCEENAPTQKIKDGNM